MRSMFARCAAGAGVVLVSALVIAVVGSGSASADGGSVAPAWGPAQPYQAQSFSSTNPPQSPEVVMYSVACASTGNCVAAGASGSPFTNTTAPVLAAESDGTWGQPVVVSVIGSASQFLSVACSSATSCVAVGDVGTPNNAMPPVVSMQPLVVPFTVSGSNVLLGGSQLVVPPADAVMSPESAFLSGVSCAATCTAVGGYATGNTTGAAMTAAPSAGGNWAATEVSAPSGGTDGSLNAISCSAGGACEAVGSYLDSSSVAQPWIVPISDGVAGATQPATLSGNQTGGGPPTPVTFATPAQAGLVAVSCPSAGTCTAVGNFVTNIGQGAFAVPLVQGIAGSFTALSGLRWITGVACSDAADCVGIGDALQATGLGPVVASEVGGTWSAATTLPPPALPTGDAQNFAEAQGVACSAPAICLMTGYYDAFSTSGSGSLGSFFAQSAPPPKITTTTLPGGTVGVPYAATLTSSDGVGTTSWAVTAGSLPAGLTLDASTGVISGTPTQNGQSGFVVTATSAGPPSLSSTASLSITVQAAPPVKIPRSTVKITHSKIVGTTATLTLSCAGARCSGKLKLTDKIGKRTVTLAAGHYALDAGSTKTIKVKLNHNGRVLLHKLGKLSGKLTLTPTGATTSAVIKVLKFKSRTARARKMR